MDEHGSMKSRTNGIKVRVGNRNMIIHPTVDPTWWYNKETLGTYWNNLVDDHE